MNFNLRYALFAVIACMCVCCAPYKERSNDDFSHTVYTPAYASGFEILADDDQNTLLRVTRPWQGDAVVEQTLAIFGSEEAAAGYSGEYIVGAAERVVCMSTSHIALLDALGEVQSVVGVSGKQYVMNERVSQNGAVRDVGYDSNLDYEALVLLRPDVVLLYGVSAENSSVTAKLRELKIPYIYLGDYTEQSPLGKAEWMVAVAEIMGCRTRGEELFSEVVTRYEEVRASIPKSDDECRVMLNTPYQDVWYMPSDDSYMVRLIEDAGGSYIYKGKNPSSESVGISLEDAYLLVNRADVWLNVGQFRSFDELSSAAPHFMATPVVVRGAVYNNNRRQTAAGGSDFWESAIVQPDVVLRDIASIIAGDDSRLYYYQRLE